MKNPNSLPLISVVVPVYRAEGCVAELHRRLCESLTSVTPNFEIILIEDCGGDRSWELIKDIAQKDSRVKAAQLSRNFGQHYAITAGLNLSAGEWVVVMDCDLEDRPEDIPRLYQKAQEGHEVVLAARKRRTHSLRKRLTSAVFYRVFNFLSGMKHNWEVGNFRIIHRKVVDASREFSEHLRFFGGMVNWMGFRTAQIDVEHGTRFAGETSYTWRKLFYFAAEVILAYSNKPLYFALSVGFLMAGVSFVMSAVFVLRYFLYGSPVMGWPSLIVSLYFIGGIIIFLLGVIGVYLGKVFDETKARPLYLIRERINF